MAKGYQVLTMLCPTTEWVINGDNYADITWIKEIGLSEKEFQDGFGKYDAWKAEQDAAKASAKLSAEAKLEALGLTAADLKALGLQHNL